MRDAEIVAWIVKRFEKGFVNHPLDRGGATKFGISQRLLSERRGYAVSVEEIRRLTFPEAVGILVDEFSARPRIYQIEDDLLRFHVLDFAIHSGAHAAIVGLQRIRGLDDDGIFGPLTLRSVNDKGASFGEWIVREYLAYRIRFLGRLITDDPTQAAFAAGWYDRIGVMVALRLPLAEPAWPPTDTASSAAV